MPSIPYRLVRFDDEPFAIDPVEFDRGIAEIARYWTEIDDDLADTDPDRAARIREDRLRIAKFDYARTA